MASEIKANDYDGGGSRQTLVLAITIGTLGILLWFRNLLSAGIATHLWADDFDSNFLRWTAEWGFYALGQKHSWDLFWNAPIFFPHPNTLAYSDSLLTFQLIYTPLRWVGLPVLAALYVGLGIFAVSCFSLTVLLLRQLKLFSPLESCIIAYAGHFSLMMANFLPHYQLFGFHTAPPFIISLYLFLSCRKLRWLLLSQALYVMGSCFAAYLAPSLVVIGLGLVIIMAPSVIKESSWKEWRRLVVPSALTSLLFGFILYQIQMKFYIQMLGSTETQSLEEIAIYAANPGSLFSGRSVNSYWWKPFGGGYSRNGQWESAYFPGFLLLLGLVAGAFRLIGAPQKAIDLPLRRLAVGMLCLAALALIVSWGPYVENQKAPFFFMIKVAPFLKNTRAIGRYGMFAALPLGVMLVVCLRCITGKAMGTCRGTALAVVTLIALAIESLPTGKAFAYKEPIGDRHTQFATIIKPGQPVAELPCHAAGHLETIRRIMEQMNGGLYHHGHLVLGYSGRSSPETALLIHLDQRLAAGALTFGEMLRHLKELGVQAILINEDRYSPSVVAQIEEQTIMRAGYHEVPRSGEGFRLLKRGPVIDTHEFG